MALFIAVNQYVCATAQSLRLPARLRIAVSPLVEIETPLLE